MGSNHVPQLWTSITQGVSWVNTELPPPNPTGSLTGSGFGTDGTSIYLIGGQTSPSSALVKTYSNSVYAVTPGASRPAWATVTTAAFAAGGLANMGVAFLGNTLYVQGGFAAGNSISNRVYSSRFQGDLWGENPETSTPRTANQCLVATNNRLLSIGGVTNSPNAASGFQPSLSVFSRIPPINSWAVLPAGNAFANGQSLQCVAFGSRVYATGGAGASTTASNTVLVSYDLGISWTLEAPNANFSARSGHGMTVQNGRLIVVGGVNAAGVGLSDALIGTP